MFVLRFSFFTFCVWFTFSFCTPVRFGSPPHHILRSFIFAVRSCWIFSSFVLSAHPPARRRRRHLFVGSTCYPGWFEFIFITYLLPHVHLPCPTYLPTGFARSLPAHAPFTPPAPVLPYLPFVWFPPTGSTSFALHTFTFYLPTYLYPFTTPPYLTPVRRVPHLPVWLLSSFAPVPWFFPTPHLCRTRARFTFARFTAHVCRAITRTHAFYFYLYFYRFWLPAAHARATHILRFTHVHPHALHAAPAPRAHAHTPRPRFAAARAFCLLHTFVRSVYARPHVRFRTHCARLHTPAPVLPHPPHLPQVPPWFSRILRSLFAHGSWLSFHRRAAAFHRAVACAFRSCRRSAFRRGFCRLYPPPPTTTRPPTAFAAPPPFAPPFAHVPRICRPPRILLLPPVAAAALPYPRTHALHAHFTRATPTRLCPHLPLLDGERAVAFCARLPFTLPTRCTFATAHARAPFTSPTRAPGLPVRGFTRMVAVARAFCRTRTRARFARARALLCARAFYALRLPFPRTCTHTTRTTALRALPHTGGGVRVCCRHTARAPRHTTTVRCACCRAPLRRAACRACCRPVPPRPARALPGCFGAFHLCRARHHARTARAAPTRPRPHRPHLPHHRTRAFARHFYLFAFAATHGVYTFAAGWFTFARARFCAPFPHRILPLHLPQRFAAARFTAHCLCLCYNTLYTRAARTLYYYRIYGVIYFALDLPHLLAVLLFAFLHFMSTFAALFATTLYFISTLFTFATPLPTFYLCLLPLYPHHTTPPPLLPTTSHTPHHLHYMPATTFTHPTFPAACPPPPTHLPYTAPRPTLPYTAHLPCTTPPTYHPPSQRPHHPTPAWFACHLLPHSYCPWTMHIACLSFLHLHHICILRSFFCARRAARTPTLLATFVLYTRATTAALAAPRCALPLCAHAHTYRTLPTLTPHLWFTRLPPRARPPRLRAARPRALCPTHFAHAALRTRAPFCPQVCLHRTAHAHAARALPLPRPLLYPTRSGVAWTFTRALLPFHVCARAFAGFCLCAHALPCLRPPRTRARTAFAFTCRVRPAACRAPPRHRAARAFPRTLARPTCLPTWRLPFLPRLPFRAHHRHTLPPFCRRMVARTLLLRAARFLGAMAAGFAAAFDAAAHARAALLRARAALPLPPAAARAHFAPHFAARCAPRRRGRALCVRARAHFSRTRAGALRFAAARCARCLQRAASFRGAHLCFCLVHTTAATCARLCCARAAARRARPLPTTTYHRRSCRSRCAPRRTAHLPGPAHTTRRACAPRARFPRRRAAHTAARPRRARRTCRRRADLPRRAAPAARRHRTAPAALATAPRCACRRRRRRTRRRRLPAYPRCRLPCRPPAVLPRACPAAPPPLPRVLPLDARRVAAHARVIYAHTHARLYRTFTPPHTFTRLTPRS